MTDDLGLQGVKASHTDIPVELSHHFAAKAENADYLRIILAIGTSKTRIERLKQSGKTGFVLVEELETADEELDAELSNFFSRMYQQSNESTFELANRIQMALVRHYSEVYQDVELGAMFEKAFRNRKNLKLNAKQEWILTLYRNTFHAHGARLSPAKKKRLTAMDLRLAELEIEFTENLRKAERDFALQVDDVRDLHGLSPEAIEKAKTEAKKRGLKGYALTLQITGGASDHFMDSSPVMPALENRALRKKLWLGYMRRCSQPPYDNRPIALNIARLRYMRSRLLGYKSYAHDEANNRMVLSVHDVPKFLKHMDESAIPAAKEDLARLQAFALETDGVRKLQPWDIAYYTEKMKLRTFGIDDRLMREYLPLDGVMEGLFKHMKKLFNLRFETYEDPKYADTDIRSYKVYDTRRRKFMGELHFDLFSRPNKETGAWMLALRNRRILRDGNIGHPIASIACNFTPPEGDEPSLLTIDDVKVLFHEAGHAVHELLSEEKYPTISGTNVDLDQVELPSIIQENWVTEPETLRLLARHYKTGKIMPRAMMKAIYDSRNFMSSIRLVYHLQRGKLDSAWHLDYKPPVRDLAKFENGVLEGSHILPRPHNTLITPSFSYGFSGGYSFGFYSYEWCQRMADHAFAIFKRKGVYNRELADKFRKALLARNTGDGWTMFRGFSKRDPHPDASLIARGIPTARQRTRMNNRMTMRRPGIA